MEDDQRQKTVLLHGDEWHIETIEDEVEECRASAWERRQWGRQPGLVGPPGHIAQYIGQAYDPQTQTLVPDAWDHDHCEVCTWSLYASEDPEHGIGYTDGRDWLCTECYTKLVAPEATLPAV